MFGNSGDGYTTQLIYILKNGKLVPKMLAYACSPSTHEAEAGNCHKFEVSLNYTASNTPARITQ